ncbi:MAG TPA: IS1380 family transposase [Thermodesulfovibrionales bacterium]|nr:IS1380 family transposase [Thermodesulfovibrionales bacterium]
MQSKCTTNVEINKVRIEFTDKKMTAYGGFSLLAAFFEKINLRGILEEAIPIRESSPNGMGIYSKVLAYVLLIYAGGSRFSHLLYLGWQEVFTDLFGVKRLPLASTTLSRLFRKLRKMKEVEELSEGLWGYLKILIPWKEIKEDWLTFDSTVIERYGKQEGAKRGYNPKKKGRGSHSPLLAFLNKSKYVVHLWNRPGNVMSWNNIIGFFESTWQRLSGVIDIKGIIADSGFYLREFIELLERRKLIYIIAARLYCPLQRMVYAQENWQQIEDGIWITEFLFQHADWITDRRFIAVRQDIKRRPHAMGKVLSLFGKDFDTGSYRYSVWITNSPDPAYEVWKQCRPRANDENTIKELKEDFALAGFSMKYFYSTEAAMLIRVLIYNLFVLFRHQIFGQKEKTERLKTLRYKFFVLPAQLGGDGRSPVLRLSVFTQKLRSKLLYLFHRIKQYVPPGFDNCTAFE